MILIQIDKDNYR